MKSYNGFRGVNRRLEPTRRLRKRVAKFVASRTRLGLPDLSSPYLCQALVLIRTAGCVVLLRSKRFTLSGLVPSPLPRPGVGGLTRICVHLRSLSVILRPKHIPHMSYMNPIAIFAFRILTAVGFDPYLYRGDRPERPGRADGPVDPRRSATYIYVHLFEH
jgi:hypothetical protein